MSRFIDPNRPLTEEDRAYLRSRSAEEVITVNDRRFASVVEDLAGDDATDDQREAALDAVREDFDEDERSDQEEREAILDANEEEEDDSFDEDILEEILPLKATELRARLKMEGLATGGDKEELQFRLAEFLQDKKDNAED